MIETITYALRAVRFKVLVGFIAGGVNVELDSFTCAYDMETNGGGGIEIKSTCSNNGEDLEMSGYSSNADRRFNIMPVHGGVLVSLSIGSLVV